MKPFFVYILTCSDGSYYTGHTDNIEARISMHRQKLADGYTSTRLPVYVEFVHEFETRDEAIQAERQIKGWSRKKKQALIKGNYLLLIELSRSKSRSNPYMFIHDILHKTKIL